MIADINSPELGEVILEVQIQPHIRLSSKDRADFALLPGDPQRVERIKGFFEHAEEVACNREFRTVSGYYKGVKVLATSTGIGGSSTGIAVEELGRIGVRHLIRTGSCGTLQERIRPGDLIIASAAVRDDGASAAYVKMGFPAVPDPAVFHALIRAAGKLGYRRFHGIIRSHDSFYTGEERLIGDYWAGKGIIGADMETAALFVVSSLRGIKAGSILNVVVGSGGEVEAGISDYASEDNRLMAGERKGIQIALEAIIELKDNKA